MISDRKSRALEHLSSRVPGGDGCQCDCGYFWRLNDDLSKDLIGTNPYMPRLPLSLHQPHTTRLLS